MNLFLIFLVIIWFLAKHNEVNTMGANPTQVKTGTGDTTDFLLPAKGGALSQALGAQNPGPANYQSGNPGFDPSTAAGKVGASPSTTPVVSAGVNVGSARTTTSHILPVVPIVTAGGFAGTPVPRSVAPGNAARIGKVNVPQVSPLNRAGTFNPALANRPIVVVRNSPESTATFFGNKVVPVRQVVTAHKASNVRVAAKKRL